MSEHIEVSLPIHSSYGIGGLHQEMASTEVDGAKVIVSSGYGLGHTMIYVSVDGVRRLTVDTEPMLRTLVDAALVRPIEEAP